MVQLQACLMLLVVAAPGSGARNLVRNPSFEIDSDGNGVPDEWRSAGDTRLVAQELTAGAGRDGKRCARLACTRFEAGNPAAHAMLCQMGVAVKRGTTYRVTLWARGKEIRTDIVSIALSDTSVWQNCGLEDVFVPSSDWESYEFIFRATRDCSSGSRFQIWFNSTGTLWVDDVAFQEAGRDPYVPGHIIPPKGKNLLPNGSFECGTVRWGSAEWDRTAHWGGGMNRLFGALDETEAIDGRSSLRIELGPANQPVSYFDYFDLHRARIFAPLAANIGYIEVEPGKRHSLSVFMKALEPGTPARLAVRQFQGGSVERAVQVGPNWGRYTLSFTPDKRWCYILAGPDLRPTSEDPQPPRQATLWLDAVQLEAGDEATSFVAREPVEFGLSTDAPGNVFDWTEPLRIRITVANSGSADVPVEVGLRMEDFLGQDVWARTLEWRVGRGSRLEERVEVGPEPRIRGFLRLCGRMRAGDLVDEQRIRLAVIPVQESGDSRFGMNHAYPWPHLLDLCRKAGLLWVRDWSLKWKDVEPEKGRFTFVETDHQIDRVARHGLRVLGLLPFPSSPWSSAAPPEMRKGTGYTARREVLAFAPRDVGEFEGYVGRTVAHHKERITWFQVFNEPLFTSYALPRGRGYSGVDYARLTEAFARAARAANPGCRILAGIGYLSDGQIMEDFETFFAAGGLRVIDAVDIHYYPRLRPPEFIEGLLEKLNALMEAQGGRKPIWLTEYGYYADDDPWAAPMPHGGFNRPLPSEARQAA